MSARIADRTRARLRRDRQHGETEEQYVERIRAKLEHESGLRVVIDAHIASDCGGLDRDVFVLRGYLPHDESIAQIKLESVSLASAADRFLRAAWKFRAAGLAKGATP